ncbi:MAG: aldo/keto reductase [Chlorobium sp.]
MKLALGTVQFGLPYGIANKFGQVSLDEVRNILAIAFNSGIDTLDTAIAYGDSEVFLGKVGTRGFKIVTKLPPLSDGVTDIASWVDEHVKSALYRLKVDSLYALLLHCSKDLVGVKGRPMVNALERLKDNGVVQKIGVSIYSPLELDAAIEACALDLVQAPLNLFDRRLITSGWLHRLREKDVEVHVRSVFLQGILLMPRETIQEKFSPWFNLFDCWHSWLNENRISAVDACLAFVSSQPLIDRIVIGVDNSMQLNELLQSTVKGFPEQFPDLRCDDERLINPSKWNML